MQIVTLEQFTNVKTGKNDAEDRYNRDCDMYQRGREGFPEAPSEPLSGRDMECYMMGYNATETLQDR